MGQRKTLKKWNKSQLELETCIIAVPIDALLSCRHGLYERDRATQNHHFTQEEQWGNNGDCIHF